MPAGVSCGGAERYTAVGHSPPRPAEARRTETVGNATSNCRWEGTENDEDTVLRTQYPTLAGLSVPSHPLFGSGATQASMLTPKRL